MLYEPLEFKKSIINISTYDSYNDFVAAKIEEMSDMVIAILQYDDGSFALKMAQVSWLCEYYKHNKKNIIQA